MAPATENASLQILFKCSTPAIVFGNAAKPSRFAHFWQGAQSRAPATRNDIWTSKSAPNPSIFCFWLRNVLRATTACTFSTSQRPKSGPKLRCFVHFDFEMCFAPQRRALFRRRNFELCSEREVFLPFSLANVLRFTTACTYSTSQLPKVVRTWCVLHIFDFEMCFAPQRRAIFHLSSAQRAPHPPL